MNRINFDDIKNNLEIDGDFYINDAPFNGVLYKNYPSNQLEYEKTIVNGILDGFYAEYYENGQARIKGTYQKAKKMNQWLSFYASGSRKQLTTYEHGTITAYQIWNEAGLLIETRKTELDQEGFSTIEHLNSWHPNGNLKTSVRAEYGIIMKKKEWNEENQLLLDYKFINFTFNVLHL
jgi:antitoxin component YwqK of YwqJK toxin-antitoxin module